MGVIREESYIAFDQIKVVGHKLVYFFGVVMRTCEILDKLLDFVHI
jgi:hypothetical protein